MKKTIQKFASLFVAFLMGIGLVAPALTPAPVYAADQAQAAILTGCASAEDGHGEGVKCIVLLVVNILSVLVGIIGIIGIVVVGIQYLTAGGSEEQTRKAKRRLFEIILGIALYILIAALLNWLIPGFNASSDTTTNSTSLIITSIGA